MNILGINAYHGDAAAALICDGQLTAAVEEERFTRIKHTAGFPVQAVRCCLEMAGLQPSDVDHVAISRNPSAHLHRKILYSLSRGPSLRLLKSRLANAAKVGNISAQLSEAFDVDLEGLDLEIHAVEHHRAHMASSFFASPFEEAALLSVDGFGDFVSTMWGTGRGHTIEVDDWIPFPHSLGILYTAVTQYLGFPHYGDEYKVMGLASFGEPAYLEAFDQIVRMHPEKGTFTLSLSCFLHHREGVNMSWDAGYPEIGRLYADDLERILGPARLPDDPLEQRHKEIAASLQATIERILFRLLNRLHEKTRLDTLCMAGGVALNCTANGKIRDRTPFRDIYIQPAAYDAGTALGAALYVQHMILKQSRSILMDHAYWGPSYSDEDIRGLLSAQKKVLSAQQIQIEEISDQADLCMETARHIADGRITGWFQGRMEFGPRALGNRSILVDPRRDDMQDMLNRRIKYREPFRPFAPSIMEEAVGDYFNQPHPSPFMLMTCDVHPEKRTVIPAPTHVDGTGRVQTVSRSTNPLFWGLLEAFDRITGVPVLLNTSFNENEPIVCRPDEALDCFLRTDMDVLVIGRFILQKTRIKDQ